MNLKSSVRNCSCYLSLSTRRSVDPLSMSQQDEDPTFFERERDKLSREITSASSSVHIPSYNDRRASGFRGTVVVDERLESKARGSLGHDTGIRYYRCFVEQLLSADETVRGR